MRVRAVFISVAAALALVPAGCSGSGGDKAGGRDAAVQKPVGKPVTLTLVSVDDRWALEFAAAAERSRSTFSSAAPPFSITSDAS